jgi:hypothetical protein
VNLPAPTAGRWWHPLGSHSLYDVPTVGAIVAWRHAVWRVVEVRELPEDLWIEEDRTSVKKFRVEFQAKYRRRSLLLRPVGNSDIKIQASQDVSVPIGGRMAYAAALTSFVFVYPDGHYPVCATCGEPVPCREKQVAHEEERLAKDAARYEMPGVCPDCSEPVTQRQKSITFEDNIEVPLGPPVTFHLRGQCWDGAMRYEQRWAALDPSRRTTLSCPGIVTAHNDGTYECTEPLRCPGPTAYHRGYQTCRDEECHARGRFNCYPLASDELRSLS